jgi:hypothetical protein
MRSPPKELTPDRRATARVMALQQCACRLDYIEIHAGCAIKDPGTAQFACPEPTEAAETVGSVRRMARVARIGGR